MLYNFHARLLKIGVAATSAQSTKSGPLLEQLP